MKLARSITCLMLVLLMVGGPAAMAGADESLEPITITYATFNVPVLAESSDDFTKPDGRYYDPRWEFVANKFNVKIEFVPMEYAAMQEKTRIMVQGGDMPDVILVSLGSNEHRENAAEGLLYTFPEGFEKDYPNIAEELEWIAQRDAYKVDGRYVAIPRVLEKTEPYIDYISSIYYRKDLAVEAGVEIKDYYTIEELYDMFAAVHELYPDLTIFNHIWPDSVMQLGIVQALPEAAKWNQFQINPETGLYEWIWDKPVVVEGIKWFRKYFEAGFIDKEFFTYPMYEANNMFWNGLQFATFNGTGPYFFDFVCSGYKQAHPDADITETIAYAYLLDFEGNMQAQVGGNSWSEHIFNPDIDEKVLDRFLMLYDWMISDEGTKLCQLGREGIDYVMDGDKIVSLREIDPETGLVKKFGVDPEINEQTVSPFPMSLMEDTGLGYRNPAFSDYAKDSIRYYFNLRKNFVPLKVLDFDLYYALFDGEYFNKFTVAPMKAVYRIVYEETLDTIEDAWNQFKAENAAEINNVQAELNAGL